MVAAVHQFHPVLVDGDAITQEIVGLRDALVRAGYTSRVFVEHPTSIADAVDIREYQGSRDDVLVVHHSLGHGRASEIRRLGARKILVYHNITPAGFLTENPLVVRLARSGLEQLAELAASCDFAFADSAWNRLDLEKLGVRGALLLPPTLHLPALERTPSSPRLEFDLRSSANVLFVGRMVPNKRQEDVVRAFAVYRSRYEPRARLHFVGGAEAYETYRRRVLGLVAELGIDDAVRFVGRASREDLVTYYRSASVFVSMSEHEGFGVPLVESMLFDVPVVALARAAVPETLGGAGVLLHRNDPEEAADWIHRLHVDRELRAAILGAQRARLRELWPDAGVRRFLDVVDRIACRAAADTTDAATVSP